MSMDIAIDKDVPVPSKKRGKKYPYENMDIGDSFVVSNLGIQVVCNLNYRAKKKLNRSFIARTEEGGVRVWRTS